jgi:hypothetical protein
VNALARTRISLPNSVATLGGPEQAAVFALDTGALPANTAVDTSSLSSPGLEQILGWMDSVPAAQPTPFCPLPSSRNGTAKVSSF